MKQIFTGNFGTIELIIDDEGNAMGKYQKAATLEGTYIDNTFNGKWANKGLSGLVTFTVNDGKLAGNWKKGEEPGPMKSKWKGEVVMPEQPNSTLNPTLNEEKDDLYETAKNIALEDECVSVSLMQYNLKIGANRSKRILDQLKDAGIIEQAPIDGCDIYQVSQEYITPSKKECSDEEMKALFNEAFELVIKERSPSVSLLQRRLKIDYVLASKLMDQLEAAGIVSPFEGKARQVLVDSSTDLKQLAKEAAAEEKKATREAAANEKQAAKEAAAEEKKATREAAAKAKMLKHKFKSSRGVMFCKYCGNDNKNFFDGDCYNRINGHNFVYMKVEEPSWMSNPTTNWEITCNKCGTNAKYSGSNCS